MADYNPDEILADPNAHPVHKMYAHINQGIRDRGEEWAKCANCGQPYQITGPMADDEERDTGQRWTDGTVCSEHCAREFDASLSEF